MSPLLILSLSLLTALSTMTGGFLALKFKRHLPLARRPAPN